MYITLYSFFLAHSHYVLKHRLWKAVDFIAVKNTRFFFKEILQSWYCYGRRTESPTPSPIRSHTNEIDIHLFSWTNILLLPCWKMLSNWSHGGNLFFCFIFKTSSFRLKLVFDSWEKRDQLDVTCFIISLFNAQHVSDVNTSILRSLRLMCWVISWVALIWFNVCWSYVVVWLWWCGIRMQAEALVPCNLWNNSAHKSQAPEDGCINIRNMLSIK